MGKGKGYCSIVLRCTVLFVEPVSESDSYTTILKIPGTERFDELNAEIENFYGCNDKNIENFVFFHQAEVDFYNNLVNALEIPYPRVFKALPWVPGEYQGVLHMEDMTEKGVTTGFYPSVNIAQIKEVVKHLAHMHKCVLTADENYQKLWKGKYDRSPAMYASIALKAGECELFLDICKNRGKINSLQLYFCCKLQISFQSTLNLLSRSTKSLVEIPITYCMPIRLLGRI